MDQDAGRAIVLDCRYTPVSTDVRRRNCIGSGRHLHVSGWDAELRTSIPMGIASYILANQAASGAESVIGASGVLVTELLKRYRRLSAVEAEVLDAITVAAFPIVSTHRWLSPTEIMNKSEMFRTLKP